MLNKRLTYTQHEKSTKLQTTFFSSTPFTPGQQTFVLYEKEEDVRIFGKFIAMFKATCVALALVVLFTLQSEPSYAKRSRQRNVLKNVKIRTVCPARKKDFGRVLSIVSAVDLTLRFTHTKIGLLENQLKYLKKGMS